MRYLNGCGRLLLALQLTRGLKSSQVKALIAFTSPLDLTQSSDREGCSAAKNFGISFHLMGPIKRVWNCICWVSSLPSTIVPKSCLHNRLGLGKLRLGLGNNNLLFTLSSGTRRSKRIQNYDWYLRGWFLYRFLKPRIESRFEFVGPFPII